MPISNHSPRDKRQRERAQKERQQEKEEKRRLRKEQKVARAAGADPGEDPDLIGIVAGPQPVESK